MQFVALDSRVEVNGETVLAVVDGMGAFGETARSILAENGIENPRPGQWYSQQAWLDAFKTIATRVGERTLYNIGRAIPRNAQWPPNVKTVTDGLASIDVAYHLNHRIGGEPLFDVTTGQMHEGIGHYRFKEKDSRWVLVTCDNPYPCAFDAGIVRAVSEKFSQEGQHVTVEHAAGPCRAAGGSTCMYIARW